LIGIQRGMRRATTDEVLVEIHAHLDEDAAGPEEDDTGASIEGEEAAERGPEAEDAAEARRQRIIRRVASLRAARTMTEEEFRTLVGPSAAKSWTAFVEADANEAWNHGTPAMLERIAQVLGLGSPELLR